MNRPRMSLWSVSGSSPAHHRPNVWAILCLLTTLATPIASFAQERTDTPEQDISDSEFPTTIESGHVFFGGEYIPPPYTVDLRDGEVFLNELLVDKRKSTGGRQNSAEHNRNRRGPNRFGGPGGRRPPLARMRRLTMDGNRNQPDQSEELLRVRAQTLSDALSQDAIVISFEDQPQTILDTPSAKFDFCSTMTSAHPTEEQLSNFLQLPSGREQMGDWTVMLSDFSASSPDANWMYRHIADYEDIAQENFRQIEASLRLDNAAYPLTVTAMLLGVFALGHTLRWSAQRDREEEAVKFLKIGVGLILAMSALDLTWTILSTQAGQMKELNPLASQMISSPAALIAFKIVSTLGACGILLALRKHPKVQFATWWMCLVCVLLTFRWVVFNGLLA